MLGALISGAASIIGGALGSRPARQKGRSKSTTSGVTKSKTKTRSNLQMMVEAAERQGFNPLTVLRAGGLAAYSTSTGTTAATSNSFTKSRGSSSSPAPLGAGIAAAGAAIGGAVDSGPSQQSQTASDAWKGMREPSSLYDQQMQHTSTAVPASKTYVQKTPQLAATPGAMGESLEPTYEGGTVTNPYPAGAGIKVHPKVKDAAAAEERYGDILSNVFGVGNLLADGYYAAANSDWAAEVKRDYQKAVKENAPAYTTSDEVKALIGSQTLGKVPSLSAFERPVYMHQPVPSLGNQGGW